MVEDPQEQIDRQSSAHVMVCCASLELSPRRSGLSLTRVTPDLGLALRHRQYCGILYNHDTVFQESMPGID